jgi:hypothetical protein
MVPEYLRGFFVLRMDFSDLIPVPSRMSPGEIWRMLKSTQEWPDGRVIDK